jgi:cytochrome c oxidase cbb3-type subunit 3
MAKMNDDDYPTTGHEWDGIREYDKPMPAWWLWCFYATIAFSAVYVVLYPAFPGLSDSSKGMLGYTSRAAVEADIERFDAQNADLVARIETTDLQGIIDDPELFQFASSGGAAIFRNNCSQCHGAGAGGTLGAYPNLLDDDWLWGGTVEDIHQTISHGVRWEQDWDTRISEMPAFGDGLLDPDTIAAVASYVVSLSGREATGDLALGTETFDYECSACHGVDGTGDQFVGAPNLTDAIWLYGGSAQEIVETVTFSRAGAMPAWSGRLSEAEIKQVSVYVHALGGGE